MKNKGTENMNMTDKSNRVRILIPVLKYGFAIMVTLMAARAASDWRILAMGLVELCLIWTFSNALLNWVPALGHVAHFFLLLLFDAQMLVMHFGNSFITLLMLENLVSVEDLSGSFRTYLMLGVPMAIILLLPMPVLRLRDKRNTWRMPCAALALWAIGLLAIGRYSAPLYQSAALAKSAVEVKLLRRTVENPEEDYRAMYYREELGDYRPKPEALPEQPNVVVIFIEGLSQSIVEDSRNIMPNIAALEKRTLFFDNYYNHTFATYRGLISQLYSGYQFSDLDSNALVSLHSILHDAGYHTAFINTEPNNALFTDYLERMGFDDFISNPEWVTQAYETLDYVVDKVAYEKLFDTIEEQHAQGGPFFTAMYSLGTHVSLDSPDEKFGDGSDAELNKFYNLDCQIGAFMERFEASELARDTVVVITTDHATYADKAFKDSFPDYKRRYTSMDRMPMMIFHQGIEPEIVDAGGRNSVDMAPTILDYLDMSAPNYFLGESLFGPAPESDEGIPFDRCYFDGSGLCMTGAPKGEEQSLPSDERKSMMKKILGYFSISVPSGQGLRDYDIDIQVSEDYSQMFLASKNVVAEGRYLWFQVWGSKDWQDDVQWYRGKLDGDGMWRCTVPLTAHGEKGVYYIHAFAGDADNPSQTERLIMKNAYVEHTPPSPEG